MGDTPREVVPIASPENSPHAAHSECIFEQPAGGQGTIPRPNIVPDRVPRAHSSDAHSMNAEQVRLKENQAPHQPWYQWGPYLSERQWGTVREDYSAGGAAWDYLTHEQARSRAYRWGEDGIGGISDARQHLCLAVALWNGRDPILKERLFGLTNNEGNHGEDVKEQYYYLDATPTHSYLKMLYKYPRAEFPYAWLVEENRRRGRGEPEFELMDTGLFDQDRYFDVLIEYAKAGPDDLLLRITVDNRGPDEAPLHVLPQLWFRNTWSWDGVTPRPTLTVAGPGVVAARHVDMGDYRLAVDGPGELLFCDNDTNPRRIYGQTDVQGHFKDAFHDYVIHGDRGAINAGRTGTKAAAHYKLNVPPGGQAVIRARLAAGTTAPGFKDFDEVFAQRIREADEFYAHLQAEIADDDLRRIQRQALGGMIWNKQFYHFVVPRWLEGDPAQPAPPTERLHGRNHDWRHLRTAEVLSMPDKWEYPWFAAWDTAFHCIPFAMIDAEYAKSQLLLLTREWYMHPNGELPAYEWAFGDVNPPVHAWAAWRVFEMDRARHGGDGDLPFLERMFHKLMLNFTWWVNRKDADDRNVFQGGFLGLDNIGVFDRSAPLPGGARIDQADATSWMAMYCLNLMRIALELSLHNAVYQDVAVKFFEHFLGIAQAMSDMGDSGLSLWDEADGFYYDALDLPDGREVPLKVHSIVGLIPLFAVEVLESDLVRRLPYFRHRLLWLLEHRPELANLVSRWTEPGGRKQVLLSLLRGHRMKCLLTKMLDETRFLSDYGVRSLSRWQLDQPYMFDCEGRSYTVKYEPGESESNLFGGNSNWRGPIWFPINYLLIESLQKFHHYYGDDFKIEYPTGSGTMITIRQVADELSRRLTRIFQRDADGRRPVFGQNAKLQNDPHFRDHVLFHEYFHGDNGRGLGAAHQTGWTGLVAKLIQPPKPEHGPCD
jgi:hypothetical protein